jgi:DHA3 family macrolide efflux protein-like MFS transporter
MLIGGIALGLVLGLLAGGSLLNLGALRLRRLGLLAIALALRVATELLLNAHVAFADALRVPLFATSFGLLLAALWVNRRFPGMSLAFVGILSNAIVILVNGGYMPIWEPALVAAGMTPADVTSAIHYVLPPPLDANFLLHLGPLADVIPIPFPFVENVASIGDIFLTAGLAFFLFAGVVRVPDQLDEEDVAIITARLYAAAAPIRPRRSGDPGAETGLSPALTATVALERPLVLGSAPPGLASPSLETFEPDDRVPRTMTMASASGAAMATATALPGAAIPIPIPEAPVEVAERVRQHPYVRLALNGSFSALWAGQLISLFGDRLNQLALVAVVAISTGSALATGLVFFAATLPNLVLSPIAGTFVDRWDHKEVMVVSDILRGAIVLVLPVAAVTNILLVYPLIFLVTSISIFFRPARIAVIPRIVPERDLLSANSALWVGETIADVIGYPLAGLFVALLGTAVPLAFWVDAATYLASAALLTTIAIPRAARPGPEDTTRRPSFVVELQAGWRFLQHETVLLANTLQGTVGQFALGLGIALTPTFAQITFTSSAFPWQASYGFLETGLGVGNLVGGFVIGLLGARFAKGRMVIAGYALWGICLFAFAISNHLAVAIGLTFGMGVANMVFVIPSQTLFQERTPPNLMGRVVGFRSALVFGSLTIAMLLGSVLGQIFGPGPVMAVFGLVTVGAGLAGLAIPAVRDA